MNDKRLTVLEPTNLAEAKDFAAIICKGDMVPQHYKNKPVDTLIAIQWGYEVGLAPMQALQNIAVINGKATVWATVRWPWSRRTQCIAATRSGSTVTWRSVK